MARISALSAASIFDLPIDVWQRRMYQKNKKLLSLIFFVYGIFSVFSMQRDFHHTLYLTMILLGLVPGFLALNFIGKLSSKRQASGQSSPRLQAAHWFSQWLTQNMTQYSFMFCLPFFLVSQHWSYLSLTFCLLLTTLWDGWWKRLLPLTIYRQLLRLWSLLCASSFLLPILWPQHLRFFYPALAGLAVLALFPTRLDRSHIVASLILMTSVVTNLLLIPIAWRFPILSVWLDKPHFATNADRKEFGVEKLKAQLSVEELEALLNRGSSLCCVAPVVAPSGVRAKVTQEWTLDGHVLERSELKSYIQGNAEQKGFYSFFCKHNFPKLSAQHTLRCRLSLQDSIFLGDLQLLLP